MNKHSNHDSVHETMTNEEPSMKVTDINKKYSYKKVKNLFEYLKAYYSFTRKQIYDVASYDTVYWYYDLPNTQGCSFESTSEGEKLTIKKQSIPNPKEPPASIKPWIEGNWKDPSVEIKIRKNIPKNSTTDGEVEQFSDDINRVKEMKEWYKHWEEWREQALLKQRVHQLYQEMFLLSQSLERQQDELELVWGHGILYWRDDGKKIRHPVVTTKAILNFDEKNGQIEIISQDVENTSLELEFLNSIKNSHIRDLSKLKDEIKNMQLNPWDKRGVEELCEKLVNLLSPNGRIHFDSKKLTSDKDPVITYEPVLILRKKRVGYRQDLDDILEGLEQGKEPPKTIQNIFDKDQTMSSTTNKNIAPEELMFPLASNEEQNQIVKRLSENTGVTVQGPPGTGKSHTIANLISHMLAHGKRVLVTAKSERPLRVLREMIPKNIQPLCVNVFTDESNSKIELEEAVRSISETMGSLDITSEEKRLNKLKNTLKSIREEKATLQNKIKQISEFETSTYMINGQEFTLPQLSSWLTETEEDLGWIKDKISQDAEFPLDKIELTRLYELMGELKHEDREKLQDGIPDLACLPTSQGLKELNNKVDELKNTGSSNLIVENTEELNVEVVADLLTDLEKVTSDLKSLLDENWLSTIFQDAKSEGIRKQQWIDLIESSREYVKKLYEQRERTAEYEIDITFESNVGNLLDTVTELETDLKKKEKIGLFQKVLNSNVRNIQKNCTIEGEPPKTLEDIQILKAELDKRLTARKLLKRWEKQILTIEGPKFNVDDPRLIEKIDDQLEVIETVIYWNERTFEPLKDKMKENNIPVTIQDVDLKELESFIKKLKSTVNHIRLRKVKKQLDKVNTFINENLEKNNQFYCLWEQLASSMCDRNYELWDKTIEEFIRLKNLEDAYQEFMGLLNKIIEVAPTLAKDLERQGGDGIPLSPPTDIQKAWEWRKADTWLADVLSEDPIKLSEQVDELRNKEKKILEQLVSTSTWLNLSRNVTEENRKNLIAWQQSVKRIGKGTGKYASYYRKQAREKMDKAKDAVPVWVMPFNSVIENFPPWSEKFDLVIVDESSQVDIFGLLSFFRGNKLLVVGDDKQISPQGVGQNLQAVHRIMNTYLSDVEHGDLFEPKYSLYDLSKQVFPGVIMLKEHFRCLPEIIQFSNDLMYQGEILPLREKMGSVGQEWSSVIRVPVENGYRMPNAKINEPEARKIVETIIKCCNQDEYTNKTMGVISLLGDEQANLIEEMLMEELGPEEMKTRKLHAGDAYYFQGDERDVIFLSMIEAKGDHRPAVLNKEHDFKRFNVAMSRAKDQVWLFHSIDTEDLNPQDVRHKLIHYFKNPHRMQKEYTELEELCDSKFEKDVLKDLLRLGYAVEPQYQVGTKRIDLVVLGMDGNKLAVECDGDAYHGIENWEYDWNRQIQLERLGWKFFRIRGSAYYRNPEKEIKDLVSVLDEMGIYPKH
ncbi:AAA domain-containing protein [Natranaerobius trueperi]|uniref:DNA helicase n=1 Tax=Natranaerobius trueperi TaxID=759412 RepID=A0A226C0W4_9FIRM|nr:AAA domain-containing protein [Natranaerobius trueperi]OWZ84089.1 hypothetical protein CDO51_05075 [Natranaerobius trueperi]